MRKSRIVHKGSVDGVHATGEPAQNPAVHHIRMHTLHVPSIARLREISC